MTRKNSTTNPPLTLEESTGKPIRIPPINLHDLDSIRREMGKVYRDMRQRRIDPQDGTRLVYVLSQMAKVHEIAVLEKRLHELEKLTHEPS